MILTLLIIIAGLAFFFYASYNIRANIYMYVYCKKKTDEKVVALTFDDGPDNIQTPKVLKVLKDHHIPACFFCIGNKIKGNEELIRQIVKEGHAIGNHSYSHSNLFPLFSPSQMREDLLTSQQELEKISGKPVKWFRPPFGVTNPTLAKAVRELGYTTIGWNIRTLDAQNSTPEKVLSRIRKRLVPGSIILLHDRMPNSDTLLVEVLDLLKKEGYTVVPLEELL